MRPRLFPGTALGKWSAGSIIFFFLFIGVFFMFISLGERGGMTFFSNLKLALTGLLAALSAICAFFTGILSITRHKERSVTVFLSTFIGLLVFLWVLAELLFPH